MYVASGSRHMVFSKLQETSTINLPKLFFKMVLTHSEAYQSLFTFKQKDIYASYLIYVDDIIFLRNNDQQIAKIKTFPHSQFSIKDLGPLKYFLSI